MVTAIYYVPAEALRSDRELKERPGVASEPTSRTKAKVEAEPEARLWKISAEVAEPRLSRFEWIALLVVGASALAAVVYAAQEWFHLFNSNSLDQVVRALLTR